MSFSIILYKNSAEPNRVDKTDYLTQVATIDGTLREATSVTTPTIVLELDNKPDFNYVYINEFNRYYFVGDIVSLTNKLWEISLRVDVLHTYKTAILNCSGFIERNEYATNSMLIDKKRIVEQGYDVEVNEIENDFFVAPNQITAEQAIMYVVCGYKFDSTSEV